jgi:hypothetical protein
MESATKTVTISGVLALTETTAWAFSAPTAKKPASVAQKMKLAPRAAVPNKTLNASNGKVAADKELEFWNVSKYGKMPSVSGAIKVTAGVRVKATAKSTATGYTGKAASVLADYTVEWGVYDAAKNKSGVLKVKIGE